ncbi:MAG TPA: 4-alpha-glucanotransferase, partial [Rhodothermales bacterium]|nr:4-alpha-glucanotransferase [Rhodothermales bacterium]
DNDTTLGWWRHLKQQEDDASLREAAFARRYLALNGSDDRSFTWEAIRAVVSSVADLAVVPIQDVLNLGSEARMNQPGLVENNWAWRLRHDALSDELADRLRGLTITYGRALEQEAEPA